MKCKHCGIEFSNLGVLRNHIRWTHKDNSNLPFKLRAYIDQKLGVRKSINRLCIVCNSPFVITERKRGKKCTRRFCSRSCAATFNNNQRPPHSAEHNERISNGVKRAFRENPHLLVNCVRVTSNSPKFTSKIERDLVARLSPLGFTPHHIVVVDDTIFVVDVISKDKKVWIESDGEWHFNQVHKNHNFGRTQYRDAIEEREAIRQNVLLIRIDNRRYTLDEQVQMVHTEVSKWCGDGKVVKLY